MHANVHYSIYIYTRFVGWKVNLNWGINNESTWGARKEERNKKRNEFALIVIGGSSFFVGRHRESTICIINTRVYHYAI